MITLDDLNEAIKECEGQRNPNASTALKLAAFYTIKKELFPSPDQPIQQGYSYAMPSDISTAIEYDSGTEFGEAVNGKEASPVMEVIDDLMTVLRSAQPRLHRRIIEKIIDL